MPPRIIGLWAAVALSLGWLTVVCLTGQVEHRLSPDDIRGKGPLVYVILTAPASYWPVELELEAFEDGKPLHPETEPQITIKDFGPGGARFAIARFSSSDGSHPRDNGRSYSLRSPRRHRPAALVLLILGWLILPTLAARSSRSRRRAIVIRHESESLGIYAWCVGASATLFSLYAVQAWLQPSNTPWFLALAATCIAPFLSRLSCAAREPWGVLSPWSPWLVGLVLWAVCTLLGPLLASSLGVATVLAMTGWGLLVFLALRGNLKDQEDQGDRLLLGVFLISFALSLARNAGFDLAGHLASLGLSSPRGGPLENAWTGKFMAHWLLVVAWSVLAMRLRKVASNRPILAWILGLTSVAILLTGSKAGLISMIASGVIASTALLRPRTVRRLVVAGFTVAVLSAPLWVRLPWKAHTLLPNSLSSGALGVMELDIRGGMWEFSGRLVSEKPFRGWGYGASASLPVRDLPLAEALGIEADQASEQLARHPALAGGHPHNAALLVWLDLGLVGALLLAGLILAAGRSIAAVEKHRGTHAALLGLLTTHGVFLAFNYPLWEPEVLSLLWMSVALASAALPPPTVDRQKLKRDALVIVAILVIGCGAMAQDRLSRWWTIRELRQNPVELDLDAAQLLAGGETWSLGLEAPLEARVERLAGVPGASSGWLRGWAYDPSGTEVPRAILLFSGSELLGVARPELPSPDLYRRLGASQKNVKALTAGFMIPAPDPDSAQDIDPEALITLVALTSEGAYAVELPLSAHDSTDEPGR